MIKVVNIMNRIKELRQEKQLTQAQLGKLIGVEFSVISKYENEVYSINDDVIRKLSKFFGCTSDFLLGLSDNRNPEEPDNIQVAFSSGFAGLNEENKKTAINIIEGLKAKQDMEGK